MRTPPPGLAAAADKGIRAPEVLSVIGLDDDVLAPLTRPPSPVLDPLGFSPITCGPAPCTGSARAPNRLTSHLPSGWWSGPVSAP
ncbi:MAG: hypothetical protein R2742_12850 [Micropruina glycogenica]